MFDIFEEFFGMGGGGCWLGGCECGVDLCYNFEIFFEDVFVGKIVEIEVLISIICDMCIGMGVKFGILLMICWICGGVGCVWVV